MVHEKVLPSGSLIGMLQDRLNRFPVELFAGDGVPNTGGLLSRVVNVYHLRVYSPLPLGSVALTQILYDFEKVSPERTSVFVPLFTPLAVFVCPLSHCMVQVKVLPSGSLMGILQERLNRFPVEPFAGDDVPKAGGVFP
jgi:hypothetical protein